MEEWTGDETPQVSTSHTGTAILKLPVPLGIQPGTFRRPSPGSGTHCAADARQMQTPTVRAGQVADVRRRPQASVTVRQDPSAGVM